MSGGETQPRRPRVVMLGLRGVPNIQGGIEAHVAALSERLVTRGWDVEVMARRPYLPQGAPRVWRGVAVTPIWSPRNSWFETLVHTALATFVAARRQPDILHLHAVGPAIAAPLARLLGLNVVVTHHGFDYDRQKWGRVAKAVLRLGERLGMRFANVRIAISDEIACVVSQRYNVPMRILHNGVDVQQQPGGAEWLETFGLEPQRYILLVARIVPEKRQLDLIAAFARLGDPTLKLALVGAADHGSRYLRQVEAAAANTPGVTMTGYQNDEALAQLYAHAAVFVLPSSHEGMPIALLEALSFGLPVIASDIPAHLALGLAPDAYVPLGDIEQLAATLRAKLDQPLAPAEIEAQIASIQRTHSWDVVADETLSVYDQLRRADRTVRVRRPKPA